MTWINLLWIVLVLALCSWLLANLLVLGFTPLLKSCFASSSRKHFVFLAALPWLLPFLATVSLLFLAVAKNQNWIHHHCETHQPHHPHFCLEHLPEMALQFSSLLVGVCAVLVLFAVFFWRLVQYYQQFLQSRLLRRLVHARSLKNTLNEVHPLAFVLGIRKPLILISEGLKTRLSQRQMRMVIKHEVAHIRHKDVFKNSLFEIFLSIHIYPKPLRSRWHLSAEIRADNYVSQQFDSYEVSEMLVKLRRIGMNSPLTVSISGGALSERINYLLTPPESRHKSAPAMGLLYLMVLTFPFILAVSHHRLETVWGWLL